MWKWIKQKAAKLWSWLTVVVPGVLVVVAVIDVALICLAGAEVASAAWAGMAAFISLALIICSMSGDSRTKVYRFSGDKSVILDVAITFIMTWIGFSVSVTMGLAGLFIGLNVSGFLSFMRYINKHKANKLVK